MKIELKQVGQVSLLSVVLLCGQTAMAADNSEQRDDPFGGYNRVMHRINHQLDMTIFEPAAKIYENLVPSFLRDGVTHFFDNLSEIPTIINGTLQGKIGQATSDTSRLLINSTVGIGGLFDVATSMGLEQHEEDFGLTLAAWGWKDSSYFVLPIIGPSTIRDAIAFTPNAFMTVWPYVTYFYPAYAYSAFGLNMVNKRTNELKTDQILDTVSIDDYITIRNAYLQHREYQTQSDHAGASEVQSFDDGDLYIPEDDV